MEERCNHPTTELRLQTYSNKTTHVVRQCLTCGSAATGIKKQELTGQQLAALPPFDPGIWQRYQMQHREQAQDRARRDRESKRAEFFEWYDQYLKTPDWRTRRQMVLQRSKGLCEGCGAQKATQVHHTTYDHVGAEFLWELRAICEECHDRITRLDREARSSWAS